MLVFEMNTQLFLLMILVVVGEEHNQETSGIKRMCKCTCRQNLWGSAEIIYYDIHFLVLLSCSGTNERSNSFRIKHLNLNYPTLVIENCKQGSVIKKMTFCRRISIQVNSILPICLFYENRDYRFPGCIKFYFLPVINQSYCKFIGNHRDEPVLFRFSCLKDKEAHSLLYICCVCIFVALLLLTRSTNGNGNVCEDLNFCTSFYSKNTPVSHQRSLNTLWRMTNLKVEPESFLGSGAGQYSSTNGVNLDSEFIKYGDKEGDTSIFQWLFDYRATVRQTDCVVYPVKSANSRLNSFKPMLSGKRSQRRFCTKLANAGFRYDRNNSAVVCEMCGKKETLDNFSSRPDSQLHHKLNCSFIKESANLEEPFDRHSDVTSQGTERGDSEPRPTFHDAFFAAKDFKEEKTPQEFLKPRLSIQGNEEENIDFDNSIKGECQPIIKCEETGSFIDQASSYQTSVIALPLEKEGKFRYRISCDNNNNNNPDISEIKHKEFDNLEITPVSETHFGSGTDNWDAEDFDTDDHQLEKTVPRYNYSRQSSGYGSDWDFDAGLSDEATAKSEKEVNLPATENEDTLKNSARQYHLSFVESDVQYQHESFSRTFDQRQCQHNPNHLNYIATKDLSLDKLPKKLRFPEMFTILRICALLTVKITRKYLYSARTPGVPNYSVAIGTGNVFDHPCEMERNVGGSQSGYVFIEASRHLIEDGTEAKCVFVEFFSESQLNAKLLKVESIKRFSMEEGFVFLKCRTKDIEFINSVNNLQYRLKLSVQNLPSSVRNVLTDRALLISYPHGGPQVLSYGETAVVKYLLVERLTEDGHLAFDVEKLTDIAKGIQSRNSVRKMLMYSADTCPGSSGAPVITFKYANTDTPGHRSFEFERWMHYGYYTSEDINVSYLKVCSEEDLKSWGWRLMDNVGQTSLPVEQMAVNEFEQIAVDESQHLPQMPLHDNSGVDNSSGANAAADYPGQYSPDATGLAEHPAYPAFITLIQRLKSFVKWLYHNILNPKLLAEAGFFYAGYADCVRCFQCGLGLRSWKPGDDIYVEHQRFRPTCTFLQAQLRANSSARLNAGQETLTDTPSAINVDITGTATNALRPTESNSSNQRKYLENLISEIQVPEASENLNITEAQIQAGPTESNSSNPRKYLETIINEIQAPETATDPNITDAQGVQGDLERTGLKSINISQSISRPTMESSTSENEVPVSFLEATENQTPIVNQSDGKEKERLEGLTKCRHCKVNPIQELFLPCGELYACNQCAELFTHCPSCGKRILGTVTTYFS